MLFDHPPESVAEVSDESGTEPRSIQATNGHILFAKRVWAKAAADVVYERRTPP